MSYNFLIGDRREVGGEIFSNDNTNFSVTATYRHVEHDNTVIITGNATIDGHKVYALIEPPLGLYQKVIFTCTITPLTSEGIVDINKNVEIVVYEVRVDVKPV